MPDKIEPKFYHYTVTGRREFPTSALFHEQAWPADHEAAVTLFNSCCDPRTMRGWQIRLTGLREPRPRLWEALGYKVSHA